MPVSNTCEFVRRKRLLSRFGAKQLMDDIDRHKSWPRRPSLGGMAKVCFCTDEMNPDTQKLDPSGRFKWLRSRAADLFVCGDRWMKTLDETRRQIVKNTGCKYVFCKLNVYRTPCLKLKHATEGQKATSTSMALMVLGTDQDFTALSKTSSPGVVLTALSSLRSRCRIGCVSAHNFNISKALGYFSEHDFAGCPGNCPATYYTPSPFPPQEDTRDETDRLVVEVLDHTYYCIECS